jgi:hypothetical protein
MDPNNPFENPSGPSNPPGGFENPYDKQPPPPQFFQGAPQQPYPGQEQLPNSVLILVFGIIGIVFSCLSIMAILALILNIVNLTLASKARKLAAAEPQRYAQSSISQVNAGRICSIIGICITSLFIVLFILYIAFVGALVTNPGLFD